MSDFIEAYETEHEPVNDAPGGEVLRELLNASRLSQQELAKAVGVTQSTISALITGSRPFTLAHAQKIGKHFGVSPTAFLPLS